VAHAFNPSTWGGRGRRISEFEASLVYKVSSRTAKATQRDPVSKKRGKKKTFHRGFHDDNILHIYIERERARTDLTLVR
jgi:hypothetical protein